METLWTFRTKNFRVTLAAEPEQDMDLSWNDDGEAAEKIATGEWQCVTFRVRVAGPNGEELGVSYLGNSIYADVNAFRREHIGAQGKHGSYFRDMLSEAIDQARNSLAATRAIPLREAA